MQRREIVDINPWVRRARSSLLDVCERNECARSDQGLHEPLIVIIEIVDTEFGGYVRTNTLRCHDCSPSAFGRGAREFSVVGELVAAPTSSNPRRTTRDEVIRHREVGR